MRFQFGTGLTRVASLSRDAIFGSHCMQPSCICALALASRSLEPLPARPPESTSPPRNPPHTCFAHFAHIGSAIKLANRSIAKKTQIMNLNLCSRHMQIYVNYELPASYILLATSAFKKRVWIFNFEALLKFYGNIELKQVNRLGGARS